jgi:DUF1680 family protein
MNGEIPDADLGNAIQNFRIAAGGARGEFNGMVFQDSDVAKWLEAVAYSLATNPDERLERLADEVIELIARAQRADGYLNTYFLVAQPGKEWTNLAECHELYCAGHMLEAAVAYYQATGKRRFLDVMVRFVNLIDEEFGPEEGKLKGYPGHQEIELALVKLYRVTGEQKYLNLAKYFLDERGKEPNYFVLERERMEESVRRQVYERVKLDYYQAHKPVREQEAAVGHAVRALYMYSGMIDVARETGDSELIEVCRRLWDNVTRKQMYITGGVGSSAHGEAFTFDYDLPNDTAYAETCAAIALVFFAWRMLQIRPKAEYADVIERALYNGILSGMSEDGKRFFYVNPLEVDPEVCERRNDHRHVKPTRQKWFSCACCPPNIARLLASIGQYVYSYDDEAIYVHLYAASTAEFEIGGESVVIAQQTDYPWDGTVKFGVSCGKPSRFTLALRMPGWCRKPRLTVNGRDVNIAQTSQDGYALITREWKTGDILELDLPMPVEKVVSSLKVRENAGRVAIQRGPVVFCLEEADNGPGLHNLVLDPEAELTAEFDASLFGGVVVVKGEAWRCVETDPDGTLYRQQLPAKERVKVKLIPYYAWANRSAGEMLVWMRGLL